MGGNLKCLHISGRETGAEGKGMEAGFQGQIEGILRTSCRQVAVAFPDFSSACFLLPSSTCTSWKERTQLCPELSITASWEIQSLLGIPFNKKVIISDSPIPYSVANPVILQDFSEFRGLILS